MHILQLAVIKNELAILKFHNGPHEGQVNIMQTYSK